MEQEQKIFTEKLDEVAKYLSADDIKKAIEQLQGCREQIAQRKNRDRYEQARCLETVEKKKVLLNGRRSNGTPVQVAVWGATLLTEEDFKRYRESLPACTEPWWLYEPGRVADRGYVYCSGNTAHIRPVLVLCGSEGNSLRAGNVFYIGENRFKVLSSSLAVKAVYFHDRCTNTEGSYRESTLKYFVDGWYAEIVRAFGRNADGM